MLTYHLDIREDIISDIIKIKIFRMKDWGEEREKYRPRVEAEDTFQWVTASCYSRSYQGDTGFRLTPLCQKV